MPRVLTNDFSWSKSRHEKFDACRRAYYFHYYASWGGWDSRAPTEARELYLLKKLGNRYTWAGSIAHDAIKDALLDVQAGRPLDPVRIEARAYQLMQADFRHSRSKGYRTVKYRKPFGGLVEHEYGEAVPGEAWKENWETVRSALAWFFQSRWVELARSLSPAQWLEVDAGFENASFVVDGIKVFAIPDFAYLDTDGSAVVVDWKTGRARDGYDVQVLGYALYLSQRYRVPIERVRTALVYLNAGTEQEVTVDAAAMESFKQHFAASVAEMRAVLLDAKSNTPHPIHVFPMTEDRGACARCVFRRHCGRDATA